MAPVDRTYVLITAAHNEAGYIRHTLASVAKQSLLPEKWIIVSDRSSDGTDEIVREFAASHPFVELLRVEGGEGRSFGAKVRAISAGYERLGAGLSYRYLGILDADVELGPDYYRKVFERLEQSPELGLAGGFVNDRTRRGEFQNRRSNSESSVCGSIQVFRRECWERIGGLLPLKYGGEDWAAEIMARMHGWNVQAFPDLKVYQHRPTGTAVSLMGYRFQQGKMDSCVGSLPAFELIKCLKRLPERPLVIGALLRIAGYVLARAALLPRELPPDAITYLRNEQSQRLRQTLGMGTSGAQTNL
ncbi:MAG TPA: glycosyltransferase family 2 protein [Terriglobales bacterium]|jgi:cellulose synthase/poly-beta-1,6-N-acetylglucosamine synthase-like glycosyltransferase